MRLKLRRMQTKRAATLKIGGHTIADRSFRARKSAGRFLIILPAIFFFQGYAAWTLQRAILPLFDLKFPNRLRDNFVTAVLS